MRKLLTAFMMVSLLLLAGCQQKEFNPYVSQTREVLDFGEAVDPLTLVNDVENVGLKFEIIDNSINTSVSGQYVVNYKVSLGKKTTEKTFIFTVKDTNPPVINCDDVITLPYGSSFVFNKLVTAEDSEDGDVSDLLHYEGRIDPYKIGEYKITIYASDMYNNQTVKEVTVKVVEDKTNAYLKGLCTTYKDSSFTDGMVPTLTINDDGSYFMFINIGSSTTRVDGKYMQYEETLYLISDNFTFSNIPEKNLLRLIIQLDGSLVCDSQTEIVAPQYGDVFVKSTGE